MSQRPIRNIACIGEVMIEMIVDPGGDAALNVAGDTYNTAIYLSRLLAAQGARVSYVTALGVDTLSQRALAHMAGEGLDAQHVSRDPDRNIGLYAIETDDAGERSFTYWRSDSAARGMFGGEATTPDLSGFDLVFLSGITLAILPPDNRARLMAALDAFRASGGRVAYDSNHRPRLWKTPQEARDVNAQIWARTDIALPSVDDEMAIHDEISPDQVLARLKGYNLPGGALKRGPEGPFGLSGEGAAQAYAPVTQVVDTTAAGDSFNAGYLSQIARGGSEAAALRTGHMIASQVIQAKGAIVPVTLPDVGAQAD